MSKLWLPGEPVVPVYSIRNFGEPWARNVPTQLGHSKSAPNSGGGGGGKGGSALGAPTNLAATANGSTQVDLTWTDTAGAEGGWKIERAAASSGPWTQVGTNAADDVTFSDTGLVAETQYYYRVRAYNGSRNGGYSNVDDATTGAAGPPSTNLVGWWMADTGTFQSAGGAAATANADPVGQWVDQSGLGHDLLQASGINKPTLRTNQLDGLPCIRFDGDFSNIQAAFTLNVPFQCFIVMKQISFAGSDTFASGVSGDKWNVGQGASSGLVSQQNSVAPAAANAFVVGGWGIVECNMPPAAGAVQNFRVNQVASTSGAANTAADRGGICIGAYQAGSLRSNIDVAEVLLYDTALNTGADLTAIYAYINGKYPSLP